MPPALMYSDDDGDGDDGVFVQRERKFSARGNASNGTGRITRANTALTKAPQTALGLANAAAPASDLYNEEDDEEEDYEDEDDDDADRDAGGFLSKPKLPSHQYASRSLTDITRKGACCKTTLSFV